VITTSVAPRSCAQPKIAAGVALGLRRPPCGDARGDRHAV